MELVTPAIGLVFWTTLTFLILLLILRKVAWKPILNSVKEREQNIRESLSQAEKAKEEMANLQAENIKLLNEAKEERTKILKEAKEAGEKLIADAKEKAGVEYSKKVEEAVKEIENQKMAALTEVKNEAGKMAVEISKKILQKELSDPQAQQSYASALVNDIKLN